MYIYFLCCIVSHLCFSFEILPFSTYFFMMNFFFTTVHLNVTSIIFFTFYMAHQKEASSECRTALVTFNNLNDLIMVHLIVICFCFFSSFQRIQIWCTSIKFQVNSDVQGIRCVAQSRKVAQPQGMKTPRKHKHVEWSMFTFPDPILGFWMQAQVLSWGRVAQICVLLVWWEEC
jgi:hypothetical protein